MTLVNGAFDRRMDLLAALGLRRNPFEKTHPEADRLDALFVGRVPALQRAASLVVDESA